MHRRSGAVTAPISPPMPRVVPPMRLLTAIPVHNEEKYLEGVLREVARHADHILVVDDGSTDQTPELLRRFAAVEVHPASAQPGLRSGAAGRLPARRSTAATTVWSRSTATASTSPPGSPSSPPVSRMPTSSRGAVISRSSIPIRAPPEERRRINVEVTRWLNECLGLNLTDAFCGFKAYRQVGPRGLRHHRQRLRHAACRSGCRPCSTGSRSSRSRSRSIYLDEERAFGGSLDDSSYRLNHYRAGPPGRPEQGRA